MNNELTSEQLKELLMENVECSGNTYVSASFTDHYVLGLWCEMKESILEAVEYLLEIRVFDRQKEVKAHRGNIGNAFSLRILDDSSDEVREKYEKPIKEYQLLDLNQKEYPQETPGIVSTAHGGHYYLPISIEKKDEPCICIHYYVPKYVEGDESTIHAYVKDWRLVDICANPDKQGEAM